jgi:endonuclease-3
MIADVKDTIRRLSKRYGVNNFGRSETPFEVLIATILSQRTRDENTAVASKALFSKYKTPEQLMRADTKDIERLIKPSGFYRVKARKIKEVCSILVKEYGGKVPSDMEKLLELPGVGRKTANCVLVYGFHEPAIPVDTHVHRISNRLGWVRTKTPEETEQELMTLIPKKHWITLNELFVKFGKDICRPIGPKCDACDIKHCKARKKQMTC